MAVVQARLTLANGSAPTSQIYKDVEKKQVAGALRNYVSPAGLVKRNWQSSPENLHLSLNRTLTELWWSSHTSNILSKSIWRILSLLGICTCFKPHHTLSQALVKLKYHVPVQQKAGVVHRIPCKDCSKVYVGQISSSLAHRLKEHKQALTSTNLAQSAVAEHAAQHSHAIDWESKLPQ